MVKLLCNSYRSQKTRDFGREVAAHMSKLLEHYVNGKLPPHPEASDSFLYFLETTAKIISLLSCGIGCQTKIHAFDDTKPLVQQLSLWHGRVRVLKRVRRNIAMPLRMPQSTFPKISTHTASCYRKAAKQPFLGLLLTSCIVGPCMQGWPMEIGTKDTFSSTICSRCGLPLVVGG